MNMNEYQVLAKGTACYADQIIYPSVGLSEEAGEVAGQVKRMLRDDGGELTVERKANIVGELGDVLWYVAAMATDLGVSLEEVAAGNVAKLQSRKDRGVLHGSGSNR